MEELLLEGLLFVHELHVVDEQEVALPVTPPEGAHVVLRARRVSTNSFMKVSVET